MSTASAELVVEIIPLLETNYCYLVRSPTHRRLLIIDPSEAKPVAEKIGKSFPTYKVDKILLTHHHNDHVGGAEELGKIFSAKVYCSDYDRNRLPFASYGFMTNEPAQSQAALSSVSAGKSDREAAYKKSEKLQSNDDFDFCGEKIDVFFIPGHTLGHIAYYFTKSRFLFCGDTLFSAGCGKLFEGTPEQMFASLKKLMRLPNDTKVFCGHEYTVQNLKFALTIEPENIDIKTYLSAAEELSRRGLATIPSTIELEKSVNPFVRATTAEQLRERRLAKDNFK